MEIGLSDATSGRAGCDQDIPEVLEVVKTISFREKLLLTLRLLWNELLIFLSCYFLVHSVQRMVLDDEQQKEFAKAVARVRKETEGLNSPDYHKYFCTDSTDVLLCHTCPSPCFRTHDCVVHPPLVLVRTHKHAVALFDM